jgi:tRNA1Val (adenine37-N6)-methyltransferase
MSNSYFRFKQFNIDQDRCAMKVTTDACIQGAWSPLLPQVKRVLDIGTGTGLLSLMLAQRNPDVIIDAIELDSDAAAQAKENVLASAWHDRVSVVKGDVCDCPFSHKYDLVISNPPFFNNSLLSDKANKNMARHTGFLSYVALLKVIEENLSGEGYASVLLPFAEYQVWSKLIQEAGWTEFARLFVKHTPDAAAKRVVCVFSKQALPAKEETLVIKDDGVYTAEFTSLLSPYYLDL